MNASEIALVVLSLGVSLGIPLFILAKMKTDAVSVFICLALTTLLSVPALTYVVATNSPQTLGLKDGKHRIDSTRAR